MQVYNASALVLQRRSKGRQFKQCFSTFPPLLLGGAGILLVVFLRSSHLISQGHSMQAHMEMTASDLHNYIDMLLYIMIPFDILFSSPFNLRDEPPQI